METDLELEFKRETGKRPTTRNLYCGECGERLDDEVYYLSDYVKFLITKITNYENSQRNRRND